MPAAKKAKTTGTVFPVKKHLMRIARELPEDATIDDAIEKLHFIAQVEAGIKAADEGRLIPHEEVKKRIEA